MYVCGYAFYHFAGTRGYTLRGYVRGYCLLNAKVKQSVTLRLISKMHLSKTKDTFLEMTMYKVYGNSKEKITFGFVFLKNSVL